jgi:hypothetical protein
MLSVFDSIDDVLGCGEEDELGGGVSDNQEVAGAVEVALQPLVL